jgi:DNA-binding PadR family transcriptional regulator
VTVKVNVWEDENHPYYFATFAEDWEGEGRRFYPNTELGDEEAADLRRVRAEHKAWQEKLGEMYMAWRQEQKP